MSYIISIVVFPMDITDEWTGIYGQKRPLTDERYAMLKEQLTEHFSIPIYNLGYSKDIDAISEDIISFFEAKTE